MDEEKCIKITWKLMGDCQRDEIQGSWANSDHASIIGRTQMFSTTYIVCMAHINVLIQVYVQTMLEWRTLRSHLIYVVLVTFYVYTDWYFTLVNEKIHFSTAFYAYIDAWPQNDTWYIFLVEMGFVYIFQLSICIMIRKWP